MKKFVVRFRDHSVHEKWWYQRTVREKNIREAVRRALMLTHGFLTDENFTFEVHNKKREVIVRRNEKSSKALLKPWWYDDSPGSTWLSMDFRIKEIEETK